MSPSKLSPPHPGEVLRHEFLIPLGVTANALSQAMRVPASRISDILRGRRGVTGETAVRLARALRTTPQYWLEIQGAYDIHVAEAELGRELSLLHPVEAAP